MKTKNSRKIDKFIFKEEQHFSNFWFWVFVIIVITFFLTPFVVSVYSQLFLGVADGERPESMQSLFIILGVLLIVFVVVIWLFKSMKLVVIVRQSGIYYRYPPFIIKEHVFNLEEINRFAIRKYKPITEYSGWGIRLSWAKSGKAFTVKGNIGLQLYLKDGKGVLFGTQRPDALKKAMNKLMDNSCT